jgi:formate dehydrogenase subunit gamma
LNRPDIVIHEDSGWVLVGLAVALLVLGLRGLATFIVQSLHFQRGDTRWLSGWPRSAITGDFPRHEGRFDPGQRIANIVMSVGLVVLVASGVALVFIHGGLWFVRLAFIHRWAAILLAPVLAGHVIVASGLLPGYRGVWRSMHWGGRLHLETARRLWPAWTEDNFSMPSDKPGPVDSETKNNM